MEQLEQELIDRIFALAKEIRDRESDLNCSGEIDYSEIADRLEICAGLLVITPEPEALEQ